MADDTGEPEFTTEQVQNIIESRSVIEQAKGILIERYGLDADAAFAALVRHSQDTNRKVHDIAEDLVAGGELPKNPTG